MAIQSQSQYTKIAPSAQVSQGKNKILIQLLTQFLYQRPKPIFGIKKINQAYLTYFYLVAWCFTVPPRNPSETNTARRRMIDSTARAFRDRCKQAGVKVGHGSYIKGVISHIYFGHTNGSNNLWLAGELLGLYLDVPVEFHESLTPYVQMKIKHVNMDFSWRLVAEKTGEK